MPTAPTDRALAVKLVCRAYEREVRFFDTAEVYGSFIAEEIAGEALEQVRNDIVICTKFGFQYDSQGKPTSLNSKSDHIRNAVEGSLRRLKTDYIDMLYQNHIDPEVPIEEVAGTVADLIREGKVKHFVCRARAARRSAAHAVQTVTAVENQYSYWVREQEPEVLPTCEELGIGFVAYSPLGMGYLTGTVSTETELLEGDLRASFPRFTADARRRNWAVVEQLRKVGLATGATPAQVTLAWLLSRKP